MRIRISLVQLFLATAFVAVVCYAMTHPTVLVKSITISATVAVLLAFAARGAVLGRKSSARLRIALVLGMGYFGVVQFFNPNFVTSLLTTVGLDQLYSVYRPDPHASPTGSSVPYTSPPPRVSPAPPPSTFAPPPPVSAYRQPVPVIAYDYYEKERFITIGHCVFTLLLLSAPYIFSVTAKPRTIESSGEGSSIV